MNQNVKRNVVQVRLSDKELELLDSVREMINCNNNSETLREMITDENMVAVATKMMASGHPEVALELKKIANRNHRDPLVYALMGLNSDEGIKSLRAAKARIDDVDNQLSGLNWIASNLANSVNQVAHGVNSIIATDPENGEAWNWVFDNLKELSETASEVKQAAREIRQANFKKGTGKHEHSNLKSVSK